MFSGDIGFDGEGNLAGDLMYDHQRPDEQFQIRNRRAQYRPGAVLIVRLNLQRCILIQISLHLKL